MMRLTDRRKEIVFGLTLIIGMLLMIGAGEGVLRFVEWRHSHGLDGPAFDWRAFRESAYVPGIHHSQITMARFIPGADYRHIHINALGFRGPEIDFPKHPGTIRIAFLGDSMMLGAELPENLTISGTTLAALKKAFPSCRFDYVKVSGPWYTLRMMSDVIPDEVRPLEPDMYVIMLGTVKEILAERQLKNPNAPPILIGLHGESETNFLAQYSRLALRLPRVIHRERERRRAERVDLRDALPDEEVAAITRDRITALANAIGQAPVVAIAYRSVLRAEQPLRVQTRLTRGLRNLTRGVGVGDILRLQDIILRELETASSQLGWDYIDPIANIPADASHFYMLEKHLKSNGSATVGRAVADTLIPVIKAQDHACMSAGKPHAVLD